MTVDGFILQRPTNRSSHPATDLLATAGWTDLRPSAAIHRAPPPRQAAIWTGRRGRATSQALAGMSWCSSLRPLRPHGMPPYLGYFPYCALWVGDPLLVCCRKLPLHQTPKIGGAPLVLVGDAVHCVLSDICLCCIV